jgi:hypothetical protein
MMMDASNIRVFRHRFRGGIVCEMTVDLEKLRNREAEHLRCEWSKRPSSKRIIPEYRRWILSVWQRVSDETGLKTMELLQTKARLWEVWTFSPGEAPRKVDQVTF